jgi:predicted nucleic acid-binding protein
MAAYADSSLLLKLYHQEPESLRAIATAQSCPHALPLTALHRLEITSSLRRLFGMGRMTATEAARALRLWRNDIRSGIYKTDSSSWQPVFARALRLSQRHSPSLLLRSLDLLHLAAALELGCDTLLSFDDRQRRAAQAEGMAVLP